jgi:nicotinamide mononucleotide transporter
MVQWILDNYLELIGTVTGFVYLYFSVKQKVWLWPVGLATSAFYTVVFFRSQLYADMSLNIYYLTISIYGWYHWLIRKDNAYHDSIKISTLTLRDWIIYLLSASLLSIVFALLLINIPQKIGLKPSSVPYWDAFLTATSILATWMLARKIIEQWLWWIVIDAISIGVFLYKELYFTVALFVVNTIMAVVGYIRWKRDLKLQ